MKKSEVVQIEVQLDVSDFNFEIVSAVGRVEDAINNLRIALCDQLKGDKVLDGISVGVDGMSLLSNLGQAIDWKTLVSRIPMLKDYVDAMKLMTPEVGTFAALFPKLSSTLSTFGGWITSSFSAIETAVTGAAATLGISAGALVGIFAAVVVAIVAIIAVIVIYWDEIKYFFTDTLPQLWKQFVNWLGEVVSNIGTFFVDCWNNVVAVWTGFAMWVQDHVIQPIKEFFKPIVTWVSDLFFSIWQTVSDVFYNIGVIINGVWQIIQAVWQVVANWFNENVIQPVAQFFSSLWTGITTLAVNAWEGIRSVFLEMATWIDANVIQPVGNFFSGLWNGFILAAEQAWNAVKNVFSTVAGFFGSIFSEAWAKVVAVFNVAGEIFNNIVDGVLGVFKWIVNGLIDGINAVVAVPFNGINSALEIVKNIEILDIRPFDDLRMINVPQIPHLAKGAVLPANRPFLAMVGDQKHGTNIEAPLATIQEAVAIVMEDMIPAMMAGFEAVVNEQRATRQAVESIELGDTVIGQAAARYSRKMAVIKGG